MQLTEAAPTDASTPSSAAPIRTPCLSTVAPGSMSSPACRTSVPGFTSASISTRPSRTLVSSIRTTESAPSGITAPVEIPIASPRCSDDSAGRPAWDSSATVRITGPPGAAPRVSSARTANPSIEELSKPGTGSALSTSTARIRPSASRNGTGSAPSGLTRSRTRRLASPRAIGLSAGAPVRAPSLDSQHHVARLDQGGYVLPRLYAELTNGLHGHRCNQPHAADLELHVRNRLAGVDVRDLARKLVSGADLHRLLLWPRWSSSRDKAGTSASGDWPGGACIGRCARCHTDRDDGPHHGRGRAGDRRQRRHAASLGPCGEAPHHPGLAQSPTGAGERGGAASACAGPPPNRRFVLGAKQVPRHGHLRGGHRGHGAGGDPGGTAPDHGCNHPGLGRGAGTRGGHSGHRHGEGDLGDDRPRGLRLLPM